jgi:hypothetical protein
MLDPLFSYRAERRPDAGADLRDSPLVSLGIRQLHHDGFRLTDNQDPYGVRRIQKLLHRQDQRRPAGLS